MFSRLSQIFSDEVQLKYYPIELDASTSKRIRCFLQLLFSSKLPVVIVICQVLLSAVYAWSYNDVLVQSGNLADAIQAGETSSLSGVVMRGMVSLLTGALSNAVILAMASYLCQQRWHRALQGVLVPRYLSPMTRPYYSLSSERLNQGLEAVQPKSDHSCQQRTALPAGPVPSHGEVLAREVETLMQQIRLVVFGVPMFAGVIVSAAVLVTFSYSMISSTGVAAFAICIVFVVADVLGIRVLSRASITAAKTQQDAIAVYCARHATNRLNLESATLLRAMPLENSTLRDILETCTAASLSTATSAWVLNQFSIFFYWASTALGYLVPAIPWLLFHGSLNSLGDFVTVYSVTTAWIQNATYFSVLSEEASKLAAAFTAVMNTWAALSCQEGHEAASITTAAEAASSAGTMKRESVPLLATAAEMSSFTSPRVEPHSSSTIEFSRVVFIVPGGHSKLAVNFTVSEGEHVLITGPSGCGKSSLFRALAGLLPLVRGTIFHPPLLQSTTTTMAILPPLRRCSDDAARNMMMMFVPQRPYLTDGTLLEQVMYPASPKVDAGNIAAACAALQRLGLQRLIRDCPDDIATRRQRWADFLSGGEQQRLGLARVVFHRPTFVAMDESTSALDEPAEAEVLTMFTREFGMTLLSIAHRSTVRAFHKHELRLGAATDMDFASLAPIA